MGKFRLLARSTRADALILDRTDAGREEYALIRSHSERLHSQPQSEVVMQPAFLQECRHSSISNEVFRNSKIRGFENSRIILSLEL